MQTFWKKTCRELYRWTTLTEAQTRETTDQMLDEAMWEAARPWEEKWESLKVNESEKKKFHGFWESCLRVGFLTTVRGRRGRWGGWSPDWGG